MKQAITSAVVWASFVSIAWTAPPKSDKAVSLSNEPWKGVSTARLQAKEIDALIAAEQRAGKVQPSALTTDEQFIRRVMLDLTGKLPLPADVTEFCADSNPNKRAELIDRLLASDDYAKHWGRYWRDVFLSRVNDVRGRAGANSFEAWLIQSFQKNVPWDRMVREMVTANGKLPVRLGREAEPDADNGASFFLLSYQGNDAINDRVSETARVFLGLQIQCAQCHDHPFDGWKQVQFHELAGYFARVGERPIFEMVNERRQVVGVQLISRPSGEHRMPDRDNPSQGTTVGTKYLDGRTISSRATDAERRQSLADAITKDSYQFSSALVNRIWGELMGQAFCEPIDDMGPGKETIMPAVLARVSAGFKGGNYDMKDLLRTLCNTETYQRQLRPGESQDQHSQFAAAFPSRLRAEALWQSLLTVLGAMGGPGMPAGPGNNPLINRQSLEGQFKSEFAFDPSMPHDEVDNTIPQALILMNHPQIQAKIRAEGSNLLGRVLSAYPKDADAIQILYLRVLARKPSDNERDKALSYVQKAGKRSEAFEDLLWVLLNSTEFQTRR